MARPGVVLVIAALASCGGTTTSSAPQDAAGDAPPPMSPPDAGAPSDAALPTPDRPGRCFEVFTTVRPREAAPDDAARFRGTRFRFERVAVGQRVVAGVRFWNFCGASERDARVLSVEAGGADGGALDPSFTVGGPAAPGYVVQLWASLDPSFTIAFQPRAPGEYFARVVVRFPHGYYDATVSATAVAP